MKTRIISGLIMLPLIVVMLLGNYVLFVACAVISIMALYEFFKGFREMDVHPSFPIAVVSAAGLYLISFFNLGMKWYALWLFLSIVACLLYLFAIDKRKLEDSMATIVGIVYIIFFLFHMVLIDKTEGATHYMTWLVILGAFATDIAAYFTGYFLGKHKLCPNISPKKTIEGSIGGILGAVVVCLIFGLIVERQYVLDCAIIGLLCGVFSQFGDLTASIFKRKMGIKDYGNLIPGHGGILDRFDSVLFTAPIVYYYIAFFIQ